ncbi:unnamed protein product [Adineta ricciae]|uniref:G-protein coupled receptors family 1 profile domain-containing protein n=1 Tax=Adineta ricciae TaxID=249248 RepID=A0A815D4Y4_ADIRI|nr:unnamed protein product [Adineta ricciae]CAF1468131.1 unnamed protein product [Adineta ricciae]
MISKTGRFWLFLVFIIPSVLCAFFVLYHLLFNRTLRQGLYNHVVVVLLCLGLFSELTNYIWMMVYYQRGPIWYRSNAFCAVWGFNDWALYVTYTVLLAWATIERHILVFHDRWVSTKRKRFFLHYCPIMFLLCYCFGFYIVVYFIPPCMNEFSPWLSICISKVCIFDNYAFSMYELVVHQFLPFPVIVVFNILLIVRVVWQKKSMNQRFQWRKYRKMIIQMLSISFLYIILYFPFLVVSICNLFNVTSDIFNDVLSYTTFITYFIFPLFPFVCALSLSDLRSKLLQIFHLQRNVRRVGPLTLTVREKYPTMVH